MKKITGTKTQKIPPGTLINPTRPADTFTKKPSASVKRPAK